MASFGNPSASSLGTNTSGDMGSITFDVTGTYNYDCSIGQHAANGMTGTIIVSQAAELIILLEIFNALNIEQAIASHHLNTLKNKRILTW